MRDPFPKLNYWCRIGRDLDTVAKLLVSTFSLSACEFDAENLYEWFEAADPGGRNWNVSRKHRQGESDFNDYLRIVLSPVPEDEDALGQKLADTLSCPVSFGEVRYVKGDYWEYEEQKHFIRNAGAAPNGGPATQPGSSGVGEGPPSVS